MSCELGLGGSWGRLIWTLRAVFDYLVGMGDKSPKANQKQSKQKQGKANAATQKKTTSSAGVKQAVKPKR